MRQPEEVQDKNRAGEIARLVSYLVIMATSIVLVVDARAIPTSRWEVLGAGAFPMLVFGILIVLSAVSILGSLRKLGTRGMVGFAAAASSWVRTRYLVFVLFGLFAVYLLAIPRLGFTIATFTFLMVAQLVLAPRTGRTVILALVISLLFSFGLNKLFADVFNVFLPRGG